MKSAERFYLHLVSFVLQQGLQLLAQDQRAQVRDGHRLGIWTFFANAILTNTKNPTNQFQYRCDLQLCVLIITDRHFVQAAGQAGGGDAVSGSQGVV